MVRHHHITLSPRKRGYYLITKEVIDALPILPVDGVLHLFLQHTSAGLTINENADPSVRVDFESYINHIVPERMDFITHDYEGDDDMPAHIKSAIVGHSVSIPISKNRLLLGTWQGIYLCEFRNDWHARKLIASIYE